MRQDAGSLDARTGRVASCCSRRWLAPAQGALSPERLARIDDFIAQRVVCITPHPATFVSLGLDRPEAVCRELERRRYQLPNTSHLNVVQQLVERTNIAELLSEWWAGSQATPAGPAGCDGLCREGRGLAPLGRALRWQANALMPPVCPTAPFCCYRGHLQDI